MKWLDNIISIINTRTAGICPYCKSQNTDYQVINVNGNIGYGDVWCNDCKKAYHISRMETPPDMIVKNTPPEDLIY